MKMKMRCVIVDDEPLAREMLRTTLSRHDDVEVVAEYTNGRDAVVGIQETRPDVAFLDIQMPELDGFGVVEHLGEILADEALPVFVFITAYDQHALRAFDASAVDYILKPYDPPRVERALRRVQRLLAAPEGGSPGRQQVLALVQALGERDRRHDWIVIREGERTYLTKPADIEWIEADAKYMRIHTADRTYAMRETMQKLEERLDPALFMRVSRSSIINLDYIREIQPWFRGEYVVIMRSGAQVTTSRSHREKLAELIERR